MTASETIPSPQLQSDICSSGFSLNTLVYNQGKIRINGGKKLRKRVGRRGKWRKTCGRGGKGQTARSGVAINGFEGGQTPLHRRLPKRGFKSYSKGKRSTQILSLSDIVYINGKYSLGGTITILDLKRLGYLGGPCRELEVKILSLKEGDNTEILSGISSIEAHYISSGALEQANQIGIEYKKSQVAS